MTERKTHSKNVLQFGKATMYVISELGLQTEPLIHGKAVDSKVFFDKTAFSGKKVNFSRSRAIDFSWKEVANASEQAESKIRILDLNGFAVDDSMTRYVSSEKNRSFTGVTSQREFLNRPYICFEASRVNDMKQVLNEDNPSVARVGTIRHVTAAGSKKSTNEDSVDKMAKKEPEKFMKECFLESKTALPYSHDVDSLSSEQKVGNSKDLRLTNATTTEKQNDFENPSPLYSDIAIRGKNPERPGKCYLKRIFYPKGNSYLKPSNPRSLPQISARSENHFGAINPGKHLKKNSLHIETTQQSNSNSRESNKLLLPLNINVLKNSEKQKHNLKSIVKLPTVVDKRTGQVHLSLEAVAFEQSDYNKWSRRRQKRIQPENGKISSLSFPLITKSER